MMKKILLTIGFMGMVCCALVAQTYTVKFTGCDQNGRRIPLSKVLVENQTKRWQEVLYYPDTVIFMGTVGIEDYDRNDSVKLFQNVPNPFAGATDFSLQLNRDEKVQLEIYDLSGKLVAQHSRQLVAGHHLFRATLASPQTYLLSAKTYNGLMQIKMVNTGSGGSNAIEYLGEGVTGELQCVLNESKGASPYPFSYGDWMLYTGYAEVANVPFTSTPVNKSQKQSETIPLTFALPLPAVTTVSSTVVTAQSANLQGEVATDNGYAITERGFDYGTAQNALYQRKVEGSGTGIFTATVGSLQPGTQYYFRAFAVNAMGPNYGTVMNFTTLAAVPTVVTNGVTNIADTTATGNGNVTANGGATVTARGVCWSSTSQYPVISSSSHAAANSAGTGSFTVNMTNLTPSTTYYVRAYATNSAGTAYGSVVTFTTAAPEPPTVTTNAISSVTGIAATCGGNVTAQGTYTVTARGVCWSTSQNPTISNSHTTNGSGTGSFTSSITGLTPSTTYYVRAYATSNAGTAYGAQRTFTTLAPPTVTTLAVSNIAATTATGNGNVTANGGATVTARGVCWSSTSQNPTISNSHTTNGSGTGSFTSSITGLAPSTTYYVRAYATNSAGTAYGNQVSFMTANCPSTVTDYDGNSYQTVQIGSQCWMKQNLRTTHYSDGTSIALGSTTSTTTAYRYYPNNNISNVSTYGYLYNWKAVMRNSSSSSANPSGVQGICPTGWHVPSDAEWAQLTNYVSSQSQYWCGSSSSNIAKALASTTGWSSSSYTCEVGNNSGTNNATGFSAVPAGSYTGTYNYFGSYAYYWSATQHASSYAYCRYLYYGDAGVYSSSYFKNNGFSVRCFRD